MHTLTSTVCTDLKPMGPPWRRLGQKIQGCFQAKTETRLNQTYACIQRRGSPANPPGCIYWHRPRMGTFCQMLISIYWTSSARMEKVSLASATWELPMAKKNLKTALTILLQQEEMILNYIFTKPSGFAPKKLHPLSILQVVLKVAKLFPSMFFCLLA